MRFASGPIGLIYESTHLTQYDESNNIRIDALNLKKVAQRTRQPCSTTSRSRFRRAPLLPWSAARRGQNNAAGCPQRLAPGPAGPVLYNGQGLLSEQAAFNTQIGYVPQDDIVHRDLTVERALYYAAKIRLPGDFTEEQIWQRITEVLEDVELTGSAANC